MISLWEQRGDLPADFRADLEMVRRNVDLECRLVDDLLDLNRIARGKLDLQLRPTDLHEELRHVIEMVRAEAREKTIVLSCSAEASLRRVNADSARLQQIIWNVLKNAIKFTPAGGAVAVGTSNPRPDRVLVEVRDTGAGIEPDLLTRVFDAFEQGDRDVTRHFGGLGLGLAICKALTELHGGTITAASDGKHRGSVFTLQFPVVIEPDDRRSGPTARGSIGPGSNEELREGHMNVLLLEDHADTARVMSRLLKAIGYRVVIAETVAEATATFGKESFDLVLSDVGLPDGTGYDFIRALRATSNVKAIALTGYGMEDDVSQGLDAGFNAYLTKPISLEQLQATIKKVLETP